MLKKTITSMLVAAGALFGTVTTAAAQQTLNFTIGYFAVKGEDARVGASCTNCGADVDVLVANRDYLTFDISDFNTATVGGEWLVPVGEFFEAGAGVSFSRRTVPSVYTNYVASDLTEVEQNLRLRIVPIAFTARVLPLGQRSPVQPYVGAGLGVFNWRYSESGEFLDFNRPIRPGVYETYNDTYVASGNATGPIVLGGIRFAGDTMSAGGEIRYQKADGDVGSDFAGHKIDLGGWSYQATIGLRFGR